MENSVELIPVTREEWVAPELKKVDIEEITAAGSASNADGSGLS